MVNQRSLFYGASAKIFELAKENSKNLTESEQQLWSKIRDKQLGVRFRSQHPIGKYIADFYCHKFKLVIEIDGAYHNTVEQQYLDKIRNDTMESLGVKLIRFTNNIIEKNIEQVLNEIKKHLKSDGAL